MLSCRRVLPVVVPLLTGCSASPTRPEPAAEPQAGTEGPAPTVPASPPAKQADPAEQNGAPRPREDKPGSAPLPLPEGTKVLHVGDSFAGALGLPLGKLLEERGVRSVLKHTDSSYLTDWAWDGSLQKYVWKYNPDLIVVTLGANELAIAEPEQRERTVKKIISIIGERPCLWVAIPLWNEKHNGLMDVVERNAAPCVFLDTNAELDVAQMPRISDGIHPTTQARLDWATFVLAWLQEHRTPTAERPWHLSP